MGTLLVFDLKKNVVDQYIIVPETINSNSTLGQVTEWLSILRPANS